jgi:hypothetical protein
MQTTGVMGMINGRVVQQCADRGGFLFVDCAWVVEGKTEWSVQKKVNGINVYNPERRRPWQKNQIMYLSIFP